jgi:hypothetical protein
MGRTLSGATPVRLGGSLLPVLPEPTEGVARMG